MEDYCTLKLNILYLNWCRPTQSQQELSYRKQIVRQLHTQNVDGIYDNPVTLKSRLTFTQGHWKRNH